MNKYILRQSEPKYGQILFWDRIVIPLSKIIDKLVNYSFGKSLIGVWKNEIKNFNEKL